MRIETDEDGTLVFKEIFNSIAIETTEGKRLYVCLRDHGYEMKIDDGQWHLLTNDKDFKK